MMLTRLLLPAVVLGAAACTDQSFSPVEPEGPSAFVQVVDLGGGQSLVRVDLEDAPVEPRLREMLDPQTYADHGILLDSAIVRSNYAGYYPWARSGSNWIEGESGYRWDVGRWGYFPIGISFTNAAPGIAKIVRVHVGKLWFSSDYPPTATLTCFSGLALVETRVVEPPLPAVPFGAPTYIPLEVQGERISRCHVDLGPYTVMDDIEVTFAAAGVTCTPAVVTRGDEVVCRLASIASGPVARWEFEGDNAVNDPTLKISEAVSSAEWRGLAVESGTVTAVLAGGVPATGRFDVQKRTTNWNWDPTRWSYSQGTAAICDNAEPSPGGGYQIGWNRNAGSSKNHCSAAVRQRRIVPILDLQPNAGYTVASVPSGPNRGRWYVTGASFRMARASNLNPSVLPGASKHHISDTMHVRLCRTGMGLGPHAPVRANFYTFNKGCMGLNVDALIAGAWGHEGFGFNGGTGHEGLAHAAAALPEANPYVIEQYTASAEALLRASIRSSVSGSSDVIEQASRDPLPTGNWPGGGIWVWDSATRRYVQTPLRPF